MKREWVRHIKGFVLISAATGFALFWKSNSTGIPVALGALKSLPSSMMLKAPLASSGQVQSYEGDQKITVASFNSGLLKFGPFQLVPCVDARLKAQIDYVFIQDRLGLGLDPQKQKKPFVLLLQEIWTPEAYAVYQDYARAYGLNMIPSDFSEVAETGMVTISNMEVQHYELFPFEEDDPGANRGILQTRFIFDQKLISVANIHTSYDENLGVNPVQFAQIRSFMEKTSPDAYHIVGGDFNIGPEVEGEYDLTSFHRSASKIAPYWTDFVASTSRTLWERVELKEPTWDRANPIASDPALFVVMMSLMLDLGDWSGSEILDHIFVSPKFKIHSKSISFNEKVLMEQCELADEEGKAYLSDHYGIKAELTF